MTNPNNQAGLWALLGTICTLAVEAGDRILEIYEGSYDIGEKPDRSPVTTADLTAHQVICERLGTTLKPQLPIVSEESAPAPFPVRRPWRRYWLIDPLDGTREFIKGNGEFSVNIALIEDHQPVLGVVYAPTKALSYFACQGCGAHKQSGTGPVQPIHTRKARMDRLTVVGSRSHATEALTAFLQRLGPHQLVSMGSALKACLVAEGSADLYPRFGPTSEWDTGAAQCIVEEAGGGISDLEGTQLRYNTKSSLVNPPFVTYGDPGLDWSRWL
jgi:3'(2'), 5'-bisphosphate nucleotidase